MIPLKIFCNKKSEWRIIDNPNQQELKKVLDQFTRGGVGQIILGHSKDQIFQTSPDSNDNVCYGAPHLSLSNVFGVKYHQVTITRKTKASKRYYNKANGLHTELYSCEGGEVILTSNLWSNIGLNIGANGEVIDFIYEDEAIPRSEIFTEYVVVQFHELDYDFEPILPEIPQTVAIPVVPDEWKNSSGYNVTFIF